MNNNLKKFLQGKLGDKKLINYYGKWQIINVLFQPRQCHLSRKRKRRKEKNKM